MLQSTSLLRGKTCKRSPNGMYQGSFNPLPSCEGRRISFQPDIRCRCASIHFPLAREDRICKNEKIAENASIHFPLAREDLFFRRVVICYINASIHFPLAREDSRICFMRYPICTLQSTSLLRGKTWISSAIAMLQLLQSTSLLRGKTRRITHYQGPIAASIHFPLAREDVSGTAI